jgi:hypothetical protein
MQDGCISNNKKSLPVRGGQSRANSKYIAVTIF